MIKKLVIVNESLQPKPQMKGIGAGLKASIDINEETGKVDMNVYTDVYDWKAQVNESIDRVKSDKLEALKRDIQMILDTTQKKIEETIQKYEFNK